MGQIPRIHFREFPEKQQQHLQKMILEMAFMLPNWLHELYLLNAPHGALAQNTTMQIVTHAEYRYANLSVGENFWVQDNQEMTQSLAHEFAHIHTNSLVEFANKILKEHYPEDSPVRSILLEQMRMRVEETTQDLGWAIHSRMKPKQVQMFEILVYTAGPGQEHQGYGESPGVICNLERADQRYTVRLVEGEQDAEPTGPDST